MSDKSDTSKNKFPPFLEDYANLLSHFQNEFELLNSNGRGTQFLEFVIKLVPHTTVGGQFDVPKKRQLTHDEGVDLICVAENINGDNLYIQSKYTIRDVDDLDNIISKFQGFAAKRTPVQASLFNQNVSNPTDYFMIITISDISRIVTKYEKSLRPSLQFYKKIISERRITVIDGPEVLNLLKIIYRKSFLLPSDLKLKLVKPYIQMGDVFIGVIEGRELKRLYEIFGDALFYENIREYLGPTSSKVKTGGNRITVNEAIVKTLEKEPEQFLARNNGITFRANSITTIDSNCLKLDEASIVNGCQTTMSIVRSTVDNCFVLVKIVQASDSWDIAKAANFQNSIDQIDLELARIIRPQAVRAAANAYNYQFQGAEDASAFAVIDAIYLREITQEEFASLFIALFSKSPKNVISKNYTEVRTDIINVLFQDGNCDRDNALEILFKIHQATAEGARNVEKGIQGDDTLANLFQRFWKDNKPAYRAYLAVLAMCGCINWDVYSNQINSTYQDMMKFLEKVETVIDNKPEFFYRYYQLAFTAIAIDLIKEDQNKDEMLRYLHTTLERANFQNLFLKLRALVNTDSWLKDNSTNKFHV